MAKGKKKAAVSCVNVSMDGATAETHDWIRKKPGSFARATAAVRDLVDVGLMSRCEDPEPVLWVIDPIDGTFNFSAGLPLFGICIGVCVDSVPQVGVVELPALGGS